jgi:hypothetical protein
MVILVVIFLVAMIVIAVLASKRNRRNAKRDEERNEDRNNALINWAQSSGLSFHRDNDKAISNRYGFFTCFQVGENRYAYNVMEGTIDNRKVCAFDYHYEIHAPDNKGHQQIHHHYFSTVVVEVNLPFKYLHIGREGRFEKLTESIGITNIKFESTEFNNKFNVWSPDKKWAYDVINQKNMDLMLSSSPFEIEFHDDSVIAYRVETVLPAGYFPEAVQLLMGLLDNFPEYLIKELKGN